MAIRTSTLDRYFYTVECIVASKYVAEYMIGYTRRPSRSRLSEYSKLHGYQYIVILADGLELEDARLAERYLQEHIWASPKTHSIYRKYEAVRRSGRHFPSVGPTSKIDPHARHVVYMAWWDQHT